MKLVWQTYGPVVRSQAEIVWRNSWMQTVTRHLVGGASFGFGALLAVLAVGAFL